MYTLRNRIGGILTLFALAFSSLLLADEISQTSIETLIDRLQEIESPGPGLHPTAFTTGFLATSESQEFAGGVLGSARPSIPPAMKELVRRGASAIPALLSHLDDQRPTKLEVRGDSPIFWGTVSNAYNNRPLRGRQRTELSEIPIEFPYRVRLGDVCLVILGQITNRPQVGVRYQPTGGVLVSSPTRFQNIVSEIRSDWFGVDSVELRESLILDISEAAFIEEREGALERIRFYFPDYYDGAVAIAKKTPLIELPAKLH